MASDDNYQSVTELRIHGVGGATPEEVLDLPHVELVAGADDAGFFRPQPWIDTGLDWDLEAYSWGGITSRSRSRALWIFLLPFALLNVAGWMQDEAGAGDARQSPRSAMRVALVRMEGLITTAAFTVAIAILTVELIGFRCVSTVGCVDNWLLAPWNWFANDALDGVAIGTAVAALIMTAIATIARSRRRDGKPIRRDPQDPAVRAETTDEGLWFRPDVANGLSLIHLATALSLVSLAGVETAARLAGRTLGVPLVGGSAILLISTIAMLAFGFIPRRAFLAIAAAAGVLVLVTISLIAGLKPDGSVGDGPVLSITAYTVFSAFLVLFVFRWITYLWKRFVAPLLRWGPWSTTTGDPVRSTAVDRDGETEGPDSGTRSDAESPEPLTPFSLGARPAKLVAALRHWAASTWRNQRIVLLSLRAAVPVLGTGIALIVGAGILLRVDETLGTDYPTLVLDRIAVFGLGWIVLTIATATWVWFSNPGRTPRKIATEYAERLGDDAPIDEETDRLWLQRISSAESVAKITDHVETVITVPAVIMFGVIGVTLGVSPGALDWLAALASWVLSLIPVGLIIAFNSLYRSRSFRRTLGIIWDVATFWPKWFHPWAPPSYGEQAVPRLVLRLKHLTANDGYVVVSGHSQGTVVAAAALAQLGEPARQRVAVVTAGSPLTRLYARYFGELFNVDGYRRLAERLGHPGDLAWTNLFRKTDYIGGPVFGDDDDEIHDSPVAYVDIPLLDPHSPEPLMPGDPRPKTLNHSNYYRDPKYRATVERFVQMFRN